MLDSKLIRSEPEKVINDLKSRGMDDSLVNQFLAFDEKWRGIVQQADILKSERNKITEQIAVLKREKNDAEQLLNQMKETSGKIKDLDEEASSLYKEIEIIALMIPNLPSPHTPFGESEKDNKEIRKWGEPKQFSFDIKPHWEIAEKLNLVNFKEAAKMSGSRFAVYHGLGAKLERALINFMLDLHTSEHEYEEVFPPALVNTASMTGTGQLPKFEDDLYKCSDDMWLIPTAEVCVTNIHREEIIQKDKLPINYCAYTPCFRREAGSYGKDVRGLIRQHQFNKVEMVKFVEPEKSFDELEKLTTNAEKVLQKLEIPYRVIELCTADLGFASAKTYDLEVWFPSENKYREISSCSNFTDFQARRAQIRYKGKEAGSKTEYLHTLNGSGVAVGRCFAAILENYQQEDGTIVVPDVLKKYIGTDILT